MISIMKQALRMSAVLLVCTFISSAQTASAQVAPDVGITHEQADQILQELRQIHQLLANNAAAPRPQPAAPAALNGKLNIAGLPFLGQPNAPLTMIEISDYQCPFCRAFHNGTFVELKKNWIDTGRLRFVSWDMPLAFHSNAAKAAQAARCAEGQNKFWEFRSLLIANSDKLSREDILSYVQQVPQLDLGRFKACIESDKFIDAIKKEVTEANGQGISGTPTFLIGEAQGDEVNGMILVGAKPYAEFDTILKEKAGK
jgi:protein-disulfide isomerase